MRWTSLGHACWLIEAAGLRLLCDPLVYVEHHGGVFEVSPRRRLRAEALRADFLLISHRHPDHFDIPSLAALARLDPDTVVLTPDPLITEAATALGFRNVKPLPPGQRAELDGLTFVTTESLAPDEWGVMVAADSGVVWNMVDTVLRDVDHVRRVRDVALAGLGHDRVDLALVQGQPMHEIAAQLGRAIDFPYARYGSVLAQLAAIDARCYVPSAAGTVHAPDYAWLNAIVYPVDAGRLCRDLERACPDATIVPPRLGARFRVGDGAVIVEDDLEVELIERVNDGPRCSYRPVEVPALRGRGRIADAEATIASWLERALAPELARAYPGFDVDGALRLVVEVAFVDGRASWTVVVDGDGAQLRPGFDPDWDALNLADGALLVDVIEGRRHWGDLLLGGALRAVTRAYAVGPRGLRRANVGEVFLYYALSYAESTRRAVAWELAHG